MSASSEPDQPIDEHTLDLMALGDIKQLVLKMDRRQKADRELVYQTRKRARWVTYVDWFALVVLAGSVIYFWIGRGDARAYYNEKIHQLVCSVPPGNTTADELRYQFHCGAYKPPLHGPGAAPSSSCAHCRQPTSPAPRPSKAIAGRDLAPTPGASVRVPQLRVSSRTAAASHAPRTIRPTAPRPTPAPSRSKPGSPPPPPPVSVLPVCVRGGGLAGSVLRIVAPSC